MKRTSVRTDSVSARQTTKTTGQMQSKIPQYVHGEKKKTKAVPDFGKLHERWQKKLEEGKVCQKKPQTMPTEFNLSKSKKPDTSKHAKKQLFSVDDFEANHKSLDAILRGLPQREVASRRATTATGRDVKRSQSCTNVGRRRVLGDLPHDPDQTSKANRRRSRSARAEVPLKALKESDEVSFEPDPQALRSIINSEGMTPVRVAAPKRQTTSGAVIRQFVKERPSIYDAMTSSRNSFAAVRLTGKTTTASHPHKRHDSSPGQKRPQPSRDPAPPHQREQTVPKSGHGSHQQGRDPHEKSKKSAEIEPQSLDDEFEVDPQSLKSIINSEGMTPVRVTAPVRRTLGGHALRQERPSIYDAMTSSRNHSLFGQVRLSEYSRSGPRTGKGWPLTGSCTSPVPTSFPFGRTPAKGPVPDLIRSATKSEARRVPRNENGILADGPSRRLGEQKHVKWADVFEESAAKEKDNVQKTLFTTNEDSEEEGGESKENICPLIKPLTPGRVCKRNNDSAKSIPQFPRESGQSRTVQSDTGQRATVKASWGQTLRGEGAGSGASEFGEGLEPGSSSDGESRVPASGTDGSVYKRGLFPTTADKANCHDDSPHVSEDVLPISGDRSCIREGVTHSSVVLPQACSRQLAGDSECNSNPRKDTCLVQEGPYSTNLESSKRLQHPSLIVEQGLRNPAPPVLQNLPGNLSEDSAYRWENPVVRAEALQLRDVQATSNAFIEKENKINRDDGKFRDCTLEQGNLLAFAPSDGFNVIKENLATSGIPLFPTTKDSKDHGTLDASSFKHPPAQCEQPVLLAEKRQKNAGVRNSELAGHIASDCPRDDLRGKKRYFGTYNSTDVLRSQAESQERQCETRQSVINKTTLQENRTMAMFTEGDQEEGSQGPTNSARDQSAGGGSEHTRDSVGNFVGRVQKSKKRQSIAELNESISESNLHMQTLCQQAQSLRNQSKTRKNNNIMYQLELIRKQQEELLKLQRELQEQLQTEAESQEVEGHTDNQWSESGRGTMDTQVSELISSSERMLSIRDEDRLTQNLESIMEEEKNNNDSSYNVKSPVNPFGSKREDLSVMEPCGQLLASKTLFSTPRTSQFSHSIQSHPLTPSLQNRICDAQSSIPLIQSPKPVKPSLDVQREGSKSPSPPPIWTAMALKSEAERQTTPDARSSPSVKRRLEHDPDYAISVPEEPMDLSTKSVQESSLRQVPSIETSVTSKRPLSASSSTFSSPKPFQSLEVGSLSLRANTTSSPLLTHNPVSRPPLTSSRPFQPTQEIPLYKEVLSIANEQRYREALLDDECARYCCRLQATQPLSFWFNRGYVNPVATVLSNGDEMHFVPIHEDLLPVVSVGEGSAFYSYSP